MTREEQLEWCDGGCADNECVCVSSKMVEEITRLRIELEAHKKQQGVLLEAVKVAYQKHCLNDDRVGWKDLDVALFTALTEAMGDTDFRRWLNKISP